MRIDNELRRKLTARILVLLVILSMILSATGCTSESESETGVILIYTEENVTFL